MALITNGGLMVFSGSAHPALTEKIWRGLLFSEAKLGQRELNTFSNGNMLVQIKDNVRGRDVFVVQTSWGDPGQVHAQLFELLMLLNTLKHASAGRVTAVLPYFPYGRSDKKDRPRIPITARLMAEMLETAGADHVLTVELHAAQIAGFFRIPSDTLDTRRMVCAHLKSSMDLTNAILVAPDAGEMKKLGPYAGSLQIGQAAIDKVRKGHDDKAKAMSLIGDVGGMHCIIVDDEIATGGTLIEAAEMLHENGAASITAVATHGVLCGPAMERIGKSRIQRVIVTDTIPVEERIKAADLEDRFTVLPIAPLLAKAIHAIHTGDSVSELVQ